MHSLIFIYNAKSGAVNTLFDIGHKLISPNTYSCNLCALTHNTFSENEKWKDFRQHSKIDMRFYHIDEFEQKFPHQKFTYPTILEKKGEHLKEFLSRKAINKIKNTEDLINKINDRISNSS